VAEARARERAREAGNERVWPHGEMRAGSVDSPKPSARHRARLVSTRQQLRRPLGCDTCRLWLDLQARRPAGDELRLRALRNRRRRCTYAAAGTRRAITKARPPTVPALRSRDGQVLASLPGQHDRDSGGGVVGVEESVENAMLCVPFAQTALPA
jgi:hypothetical protein